MNKLNNLTLHLMVGNIGTGKTTTAKSLLDNNTLIVSDDNIAMMLGENYPEMWTEKHINLYSKIKLMCARYALEAGFNVIVDGTHMSRKSREKFIKLPAKVIVYTHTNKDGLYRRLKDPRGCTKERWTEIWNLFESQYEEPSFEEGMDEIILP